MVIGTACGCALLVLISITSQTVEGTCSVTVDGVSAFPSDVFNVNDEVHYSFHAVYQFGRTMELVFNNTIDSWTGKDSQAFRFKENTSSPEVCYRESQSFCVLTNTFVHPFHLANVNRLTKLHKRYTIYSEDRDVCILDLTVASGPSPIDFDMTWLNQTSGFELRVNINSGFPGPFDVITTCDAPATFLSGGGAFILIDDLSKSGTEKCEVTVSSRVLDIKVSKHIDVPNIIYSTRHFASPLPPSTPQTASTPYLNVSIAISIIAGCFLVAVVGFIIFICKKKSCHTSVLQVHVGSTPPPSIATVENSHAPPARDASYHSDDGSCESLETDGPPLHCGMVHLHGLVQSQSILPPIAVHQLDNHTQLNNPTQLDNAAQPDDPAPPGDQAQSGDLAQPGEPAQSCGPAQSGGVPHSGSAIIAHPEEDVGAEKFGTLTVL